MFNLYSILRLFYGNDIYINEKFRYISNEILIAYLNDRHVKNILESDYSDIKSLVGGFVNPVIHVPLSLFYAAQFLT